VLRYFSLIKRLLLAYKNPKLAKLYKWHAQNAMDGGVAGPIDGTAWKRVKANYPGKLSDSRSMLLALAMDGVSPFHMHGRAAPHDTWPVVMTTYNMPPFLAGKEGFSWLSMLLPGPCCSLSNQICFSWL
jgi:hypothetical protein